MNRSTQANRNNPSSRPFDIRIHAVQFFRFRRISILLPWQLLLRRRINEPAGGDEQRNSGNKISANQSRPAHQRKVRNVAAREAEYLTGSGAEHCEDVRIVRLADEERIGESQK